MRCAGGIWALLVKTTTVSRSDEAQVAFSEAITCHKRSHTHNFTPSNSQEELSLEVTVPIVFPKATPGKRSSLCLYTNVDGTGLRRCQNSGGNFHLLLTVKDSSVTPTDERLYVTLSEPQNIKLFSEKTL